MGQHINSLKAELSPICHLLALLGAHLILHVSRIRVNALFSLMKMESSIRFTTTFIFTERHYAVPSHVKYFPISKTLFGKLCQLNHGPSC
jgi:hypothetical protein